MLILVFPCIDSSEIALRVRMCFNSLDYYVCNAFRNSNETHSAKNHFFPLSFSRAFFQMVLHNYILRNCLLVLHTQTNKHFADVFKIQRFIIQFMFQWKAWIGIYRRQFICTWLKLLICFCFLSYGLIFAHTITLLQKSRRTVKTFNLKMVKYIFY